MQGGEEKKKRNMQKHLAQMSLLSIEEGVWGEDGGRIEKKGVTEEDRQGEL